MTIALLDVALCCMICQMVHENWQKMAPDTDSDSELESIRPEGPQSESEAEDKPEDAFATFDKKVTSDAKAFRYSSMNDFSLVERQHCSGVLLTQDVGDRFVHQDEMIAPNVDVPLPQRLSIIGSATNLDSCGSLSDSL